MNVNDLRAELARRADQAAPSHHNERMAGVVRKRDTYRRVQVAGAAGLTALGVIGVILLAPMGDQLLGRGENPAPATQEPTPESKDAFVWPTEYQGDKLIASVIGEPGQDRVTLRFVPESTDLQWSTLCTAPWPKAYGTLKVNGNAIGGGGCSADDRPSGPTLSVGAGGKSLRFWAELGVRPGEPSVAEVVMTGDRVLPDDARLGFAIWDRSGPRVTSDGVTLNRLWEADGAGTYRLVAYETQPLTPSVRELSLAVPDDLDDPVVLSGLGGSYPQVRGSTTTTTITGTRRRDVTGNGGIGGGVVKDVAGETVTIREGNEHAQGTLVIAIYAPVD